MKYRTTGVDGVVNIYKEKGYTSHDVVAIVRKLTGCKTGHTGTLDPDAEGVLPVCLGKATRISDYIAAETKEYTAVIAFGTETDTQDASGVAVYERALDCSEDALRAAMLSFIGDYEQLPPMYSALKVNGKKLYELAREGKEVERKARPVRILDLQILEMDYPYSAVMHVVCSKGTYIRTLCTDIGRRAGASAHMAALLRTRTGAFTLAESVTLDAFRQALENDGLLTVLKPMESALSGFRTARAVGADEKLLHNGGALPLAHTALPDDVQDGERLLLSDGGGCLVGIYVVKTGEACLRPLVVLL